jgi:hypothetical protein
MHRHVSSDRRRARIKALVGNDWIVLAACRCGAVRRELVRYEMARYEGRPERGRLLLAGQWKESAQ